MQNFAHLHCHTEYSLLDGAIRIKDLCVQAKDFGMSAVAITDHGNLHGAIPFYKEAKKSGLKAIIGCEVYVCPDHTDRSPERGKERYHLVLLAQNLVGYHNLVKIVTHGALFGFHYKPRVDKDILRRYSDGVIALSACLSGEIPRALQRKGKEAAKRLCEEYSAIFPGRFFLEVQENGLIEQASVNKGLLELSKELDLPLVATNDCHYLRKDDVEAHDVLLCIQTQATVNETNRMRMDTHELYYKSVEEMEKDFAWAPEALENAGRIVDMCEDYNFEFNKAYFPRYDLPEGVSLDDEFRRLSREGLEERLAKITYDVDRDLYRQRLEMELDVIGNMGYQGYFLIVQDFINWAKNNNVPVGPGRGSAAGSIVSWALRITNLDPIPYNLLFERFLNPERVSLPDIDVDFCERKRLDVLQYVSERYGEDSVSQITTFGTMKAKAAVKDVGRALGINYVDTNRIAKLIPEDLKMTLTKALEQEPELKVLYDTDPQVTKLIDIALRLEGLARHASTHAAGVVISDKPMVEYLPLYRGKKNEIVTQYDKNIVEEVGLVKFDFLGLRTMTLIQDTLDLITAQGREAPDLDTLPFDDPATYRLYSSGDTDGVFQVESSGMRKYLRKLKPNVFEDIIAMLALYRPGPLGANMVDEFIDRKHGVVQVEYPHPSLENCLKDTYGVIVYQEQVMQIGQIIANYTLGGADMLRRAMGKKKPEAMAAEREKFLKGAAENNVKQEVASDIFDLMEKFAEYGFNKSHSAAYAVVSYHTAYLKTHYKPEFMAALLTSEMGDQDKVLKYVAACKDMGIKVEAPSVQESRSTFSVQDGRILFGLGGIKNVGGEAIREIIEAREKDGPYVSLYDLCCRVNLRKVTKRVLENLIKSGAFDFLKCSRQALMTSLDVVVGRAQKKQKDANSNQMSMLSLMLEGKSEPKIGGIGLDCPEQKMGEWPDDIKLGFEKDALGFFLSSHPLQPYRRDIQRMGLAALEDVRDLAPGMTVKVAILMSNITDKLTKKGSKMAVCQINDLTASGECLFFSKSYEQARHLLAPDVPVELTATISRDRDADSGGSGQGYEDEDAPLKEIKLIGESVRPLIDAVRGNNSPWEMECSLDLITPEHVSGLQDILQRHKGTVEFNMFLYGQGKQCHMQLPNYRVLPGPDLGAELALWEENLTNSTV